MNPQDFVHLHVHTEYSLLDGACRIKELPAKAKELGMTALAITDHGVMYGAIDFYKECKKQGIKPIIGCEVYVAPRTRFDKDARRDTKPYHLVLLCENETGYRNLTHLVSCGFTEGFYSRPRIDRDLLQGHTEGLIALSACLAGEIPRALMENDYERAKETALWYAGIFGPEHYYIEIQNHGIDEQKRILPDLIRLSQETGIGLVATNDTHYLTRQDHKMHHILLCIQTGKTVDDETAMEFPTEEFYLKSGEEMAELFSGCPSALENTRKIADRCQLEFEFGKTKLPYFRAPDGEDNVRYFRRLCQEGLYRRYGEHPPKEYQERLDYELDVVEKMGYVDYYLIVYDFIHYAKSKGIPVGPGRGSGAGSIAAYCIGITGIDPMRFSLIFERFLNPERVSMPDFDIDFCVERRQEVIEYVQRRYGNDHVAQIVTFGTMAARGAIRDVGRAMGLSYQTVDRVAKLIPMELHITIDKAMGASRELQAVYGQEPEVRELIDMARRVEGMPRHASTHAAGVVITRDPVESYVPLAKNDEAVVTQYTMTTLEELGLLKMDFLGLRNLTVIRSAEEMIRRKEPDFQIEAISLEEPDVFEMLSEGSTGGVFQFESGGMRKMLVQLHPTSIEDMIAAISLYRPGPMESIPRYIENRHHPEKISYLTHQLKPILDVTYGCIVYQEQVMQICRSLAGYTYGQSDLVRRAMAKKKAEVMEKERGNFIQGCAGNGISGEIANQLFDQMSSFAAYAFNKSHAAAYAVVAYQTAYLKCRYPREYMAALLSSVLDNSDKVTEYIEECGSVGIKVLPPDINYSGEGFTVTGQGIRFGLLAIRNLGVGVIRRIVEEREQNGLFQDFGDFCRRLLGGDLNRRAMESLIKSGAFDCLEPNRNRLLQGFPRISEILTEQNLWMSAGQTSLFGNEPSAADFTLPDVENFTHRECLAMEKEVTGMYLSGHPMMQYADAYRKLNAVKISQLRDPEENRRYDNQLVEMLAIITAKRIRLTKNNDNMAILTLEDNSGSLECLVFAKAYGLYSRQIQEGEVVSVLGRVSVRDEEPPRVIVEQLCPIEERLNRKENAPAPPPRPTGKEGLYLRVPSMDAPVTEQIKCLLEIFEGPMQVFFRAEDTGKMLRAPARYKTEGNEFQQKELKRLLGNENVKIL